MTKHHIPHFRIWITACMLAVFMAACVDAIDFKPRREADLLVVDGKVSASPGPHYVRLTKSDKVGRSDNFPPVTGAELTLLDDQGLEAAYSEINPGLYEVYTNCVPGRAYRLRLRIANGLTYESTPDLMPQSTPADGSYFTFTSNKYLNTYARFRNPDTAERGPYLKWRMESQYQISEVYCSPLDPVLICYFTRRPDNQLLPLANGSQLERGVLYDKAISTHWVDDTYGEVTYFNIFQESLSLEAYQYWQKINLVLSQRGSIFDSPPGAVRGNIFNTSDQNELVLGYFYASPEDTTRLKVTGGELIGADISPYCGVAGFINYDRYLECCNCTRIPGSTLEKPWYWE